MSGCQDLHSCTYIMTLKFMLTKSAQPLLQGPEEDVPLLLCSFHRHAF